MDITQEPQRIISICTGIRGLEKGIELAGIPIKPVVYLENEIANIANLVAGMEAGLVAEAPIWPDLTTFRSEPFRGKIHGIVGGYPCFPAGTMVLTDKGYKDITLVTTKDYVLTHKGRWRRVTSVQDNGITTTRTIKAQGVPGIRCTDDHPFFASSSRLVWNNDKRTYQRTFSEPGWLAADQLSKEHFLYQCYPKGERKSEYGNDFWWIIGRYIADGYSQWSPSKRHKRSGSIILCIGNHKTELVESKLAAAGFKAYKAKSRTATKYHISKHWLYEFVQQFGKGAAGKTINRLVFELSTDKARSFMDGYLSGDGYKNRKQEGWTATTVSKSLALGLAILWQKTYGVVATVRETKRKPTTVIEGRTVNQRNGYRIDFPATNKSARIKGIYGQKRIKYNIPNEGKERVYNISVAQDESYMADGAIVHNCTPFSSAGKRQGAEDKRHLYPYIESIIKATRPLWCFFENVDDHLSLGYDYVQKSLYDLGYRTEAGVYTAFEAGASHERKRLFILAVTNGIQLNWPRSWEKGWWNEFADQSAMANASGHGHDATENRSSSIQGKRRGTPGQNAVEQLERCSDERIDDELADPEIINGGLPIPGRQQEQESAEFGRPSEAMANTNSGGSQQDWQQAKLRPDSFEQSPQYCRISNEGKNSKRGFNWGPAGPGQEQYEWELPRTIKLPVGGSFDGNALRNNLLYIEAICLLYAEKKDRALYSMHELWCTVDQKKNEWTLGGLLYFLETEILFTTLYGAVQNGRITEKIHCCQDLQKIQKEQVREMWFHLPIGNTPQGREYLQQLRREFADAMCILSYEAALARRKETCSGSEDIMPGLWNEYKDISWNVPETLPTMEKEWRPFCDSGARERQFYAAYKSFRLNIFGSVFGYKFRDDCLRSLGNAVVPWQSATAIVDLVRKHVENAKY